MRARLVCSLARRCFGPKSSEPFKGFELMRAIFLSVIAWGMFSAAASAQAVIQAPAPAAAETQSFRIAGQCLDVRSGLTPAWAYGRAPVIRWRCTGRDNQDLHLQNGSLLFGAERNWYVRPMYIPTRGCYDDEISSEAVRYVFHVCGGRGAFSVDRSESGVVKYNVFGRAGTLQVVRGIPLMAERIGEGRRPVFTRWALNANGDRLMVEGTNFCVTPPSADASEGAPLYLDTCDAPDQVDATVANDGAARATLTVATP
jgi:hypothetical protein